MHLKGSSAFKLPPATPQSVVFGLRDGTIHFLRPL